MSNLPQPPKKTNERFDDWMFLLWKQRGLAISGGTVSQITGTVNFSNSNGVTFGLNTNGVMTASVGAAGGALTNIRFSAGTSSTYLSALTFSNSNGISFGLNGSTVTGSHNALTTAMASNRGSDFVQATAAFAGTSASGTIASNGISVSIGPYITTAALSNHSHGVSFTSGSTVFQTLSFTNSNGISFNSGTQGIFGSHNALTTARASTDAIGLNTAQSNVTWTVNSSGLSLDARGYAGTGTSATNASITLNSNGLAISVAAPGGGAGNTLSYFEPFYLMGATATSSGSLSNLHLAHFSLPENLSFGQVNFVGSASVATKSAGNTFSFRLTDNQSIAYSAVYSVTATNFQDMFIFARGTGGFSSELETLGSTRNSYITYHNMTYAATANHTAGSTGSMTLRQSVSMSVSYPMMTSGTQTSVNAASTVTTWGTGYTTFTGSGSTSVTNTYNTTTTGSTSLVSTYPGTTAWSSNKLIPFNFASSLSPGNYWLGMLRHSSTSSSSTFGSTITAAGTGASYTVSYNASNFTGTDQLTFAGATITLASSLGWLGFASQDTMAPSPGHGSFSGTWASNTTYLNNAGNPAGAIAFSQIKTNVSFFRSWFQFASNRI